MGAPAYSRSRDRRRETTASRSASVASRTTMSAARVVAVSSSTRVAVTCDLPETREVLTGAPSRFWHGPGIPSTIAPRNAFARHECLEHELARRDGLRGVVLRGEPNAMDQRREVGNDLEPLEHGCHLRVVGHLQRASLVDPDDDFVDVRPACP